MKPVLLGFSPDNVPIITEVYSAIYGQKDFLVAKNIEVKDPDIPFEADGFFIDIKMHDEILFPENAHYLFGVSNPYIKWPVYKFFQEKYMITQDKYISLSHPVNYVSPSAVLGQGVLVEPGVVISAFAQIGFGVSIKRGSSVGHHVSIGEFVNINPGVTVSGRVSIGHGTIIGCGAVVIQRIKIGSNCMIGAGSVVTRDIPDGVVAYGNPCKVIRPNDKWEIGSID